MLVLSEQPGLGALRQRPGAESVLQEMEASWADPDLHELEANQARHYLAFQA